MRTGAELTVIDIGPLGALVESTARLLPGTIVDVQLYTCLGRVVVRARVVRSAVSALRADRVAYRTGLSFERSVELAPAPALSA
ncbi:MAG: hypothetical protein AB7K63_07050 [Vicinamibacterales bacterium]